MKVCNYCGQYRRCRRSVLWNHEILNWSMAEWVCEDCDNGLKIVNKDTELIEKAQKKKDQEEWIKKRDKLLKENDLFKTNERG